MAKDLNKWLDEFVNNGADANDVINWPEEAGGGTSYSAGDGINITDNTIAVNDTIVRKLNISNIRSLTPEQCENLKMGDLVTDGATTYEVYQKGIVAPHNTAFINLKYNAYGSVWTAVYTKPDGGEWSFVSDTEHIVPYTAGEGIDIDINGVISVAGGGNQGVLTLYTIHYEKDNTNFTLQGLAYCTNTYESEDYGNALTELHMCLGQSEENRFYLVDVTGASGNSESYLYIPSGGDGSVYIHHDNHDYKWIYDTCSEVAYGWATLLRIKDFPNHS